MFLQSKVMSVMIVDDNDMVRLGLNIFLSECEEVVLVGEARTGEDAVRLCQQLHPDVVLMDVKLPYMNGIQATEQIHQSQPDVKVVILTSDLSPGVRQAAKRAGAILCLPKAISGSQLVESIRSIASG